MERATGNAVPPPHQQSRSFWSSLASWSSNHLSIFSPHGQLSNELEDLIGLLPELKTPDETTDVILASVDRQALCSFHGHWSRFADSVVGQWQAINYVSAVFVG